MKRCKTVSLLLSPKSISVVILVTVGALFLCTRFLHGAPDEKRISIYSTAANYSLLVSERDAKDYVGLLEALEPLGKVSAKTSGQNWKIRFNGIEGEFTPGTQRARVRSQSMDLGSNFLLENGRGLVPVNSLTGLLPEFLGGPVTLHEASRRLFSGVHFTAQVRNGVPPALIMNFTSPVNPSISTEPGKLRMVFTHEPLMSPGTQMLTFDSKTITSASYQENNGAAEIAILGNVPLFASFGNDGRTITIGPALEEQNTRLAAPTTSAAVPAEPSSALAIENANLGPHHFFAVVDAAHGGMESGATLSDQLIEKDVTLAIAKRLRQELENHGMTTLLLRDGDTTLTPDQRAAVTNRAHPAIYICLHVSSQGRGVRLYTAMLPIGNGNRGPFLEWDTAQAAFISSSQTASQALAAELGKNHVRIRELSAPLRPLNNITAAAIAAEVAPPSAEIADLNSSQYQQLVASSIATGIAGLRDKAGAGR
jgi:N-acetylmuramoyl-L-alanine amidase